MDIEEPDIRLAGFSLWVFGYQFPDQNDFWDGNWLNVRARVAVPNATVEAQGSIVRTSDLKSFVDEVETLRGALLGEAHLRSLEPNLDMVIHGDSLGHMTVTIRITPYHMAQSHKFLFGIDQTYLGPLLANCKVILSRFPVRGTCDA
jgi:hypothetical protein